MTQQLGWWRGGGARGGGVVYTFVHVLLHRALLWGNLRLALFKTAPSREVPALEERGASCKHRHSYSIYGGEINTRIYLFTSFLANNGNATSGVKQVAISKSMKKLQLRTCASNSGCMSETKRVNEPRVQVY